MTTYAIGLLRNVRIGPDIVAYLEAIDATLAPFQGRFIIHGGEQKPLEGGHPGDLIVIAFPNHALACGWYNSPAYQAILRLRLSNAEGDVFLIEGVDPEHRAIEVLSTPDNE